MSVYLSKQEVLDLEKTTIICVGKSKYLLCEFDENSVLIRVDKCNLPVQKLNSRSVDYYFTEPAFSIVPTSFKINSKLEAVSTTGFCDVMWKQSDSEQKELSLNTTLLKNKNHLMALFLKVTQTFSNSIECLNLLIWNDKLFLTYFKEGKLINGNTFDASDVNEIIYYTMLFVQEYHINQELSQVFLLGDVSNDSVLEKELKTYFRKVETKKSDLINDPSVSGLVYLLTSTKL